MSKYTEKENEIRAKLRGDAVAFKQALDSKEYGEIFRDIRKMVDRKSAPTSEEDAYDMIDGIALSCWIRQKARET